jgi:Fe-S cluster assembly protein SufD
MTRRETHERANLERYVGDAREATARGPSWLRDQRAAAIDHFAELGFPTTKLEDWRYTNVSVLNRTPHALVQSPASLTTSEFDNLTLPDFGGDRFVFVDGIYDRELSRQISEEGAIEAHSLAALSSETGKEADFERLLADEDYKDDAFSALHFASWIDGLAIRILPGRTVEAPIHVVFLSSAREDEASANHPRLIVRAETGSRAVLIQDHLSLHGGEVLTNATTRVDVASDANLDWILVQRESDRARHIARQHLSVGRNARVDIHTYNLAGELTRNDLAVLLADEGAECTMNGLAIGGAKQRIDNHTRVDHAVPHCTSRQLYKTALAGESNAVFRGRILVRPDAQRSDAEQQSRTLLLSRKAGINTKPQLEIYADDVKCSHGASIGQLDPEALFYLRARGLDRARAYTLLTPGFASEITAAISREDVRDWLWPDVLERLETIATRESDR